MFGLRPKIGVLLMGPFSVIESDYQMPVKLKVHLRY